MIHILRLGLVFRRLSGQLFSCSSDKTVKVWDVESRSYIETLFGHQDTVQAIDANTREKAITAGGRDNTIRIFKIPEETQLVYRLVSYNAPKAKSNALCSLS